MVQRQLAFVLGACMAASAFGIDAMAPGLANLASDLALSPRSAQLALTVAIAGFALAQIPAGLLADRYGRRQLALLALLVFALAAAGSAVSSGQTVLLVTRLVQGLCGGILSVCARAMARDAASGDQAGRLLASMTTVLALAAVVAPLAGGFLTQALNWRAVLWAIAAYNLVTLALAWRALPVSAHGPQRAETALQQFKRSARQFFRSRQSLWGTAINAVVFAGVFAFVTSAALVATDYYQLPAGKTGLAMATMPLMLTAGSLLSRQLVLIAGLSRMLALALGVLVMAGVWTLWQGLQPVESLWAGWAPYLVYGLGFGMFMPTIVAIVTDPLPQSAGFASSLFGTTQAAAGTLSSLLSAALYDGTAQPLNLLMGGCAIAAGLLYLAAGPRGLVIAGLSSRR